MIQAISDLWSLMTVFFTVEVLQCDLFLGMLLLFPVFATIYIFMWFFQADTWRIKF